MRLRGFRAPAVGRRAAALVIVAVLAGCADQDTYDNARVIDQSQQSSLGNPQQQEPIVAPPPLNPANQPAGEPRYEWNGNSQRVIEGKAGVPGAKRPVLKPQPPSSIAGVAATPADAQIVEVKPGDTLHGIAERYGVTVASLSQANRLSGAPLKAGQRLVLPPVAR